MSANWRFILWRSDISVVPSGCVMLFGGGIKAVWLCCTELIALTPKNGHADAGRVVLIVKVKPDFSFLRRAELTKNTAPARGGVMIKGRTQ